MNWVLASASPRRREILSHLGLAFTVRVADTDERSDERDGARLVELLARRKALAVWDRLLCESNTPQDTVVIAADTVVVSPDGDILGKPRDDTDAARMLRLLSDNTHRVITGIATVKDGTVAVAHEITEVTFAPLSDETITRYIQSGEPRDKAGAYGIQDTAALWIRGIRGDYFNVVGLPVHRLDQLLLQSYGISLWQPTQNQGN